MWKKLVLIACLLQSVICENNTSGMYTITAPGTLRSESKYTVVAALHEADKPCTIDLSINGPSYNETKEVKLESKSTQQVTFDVPKLTEGKYILKAVGTSGLVFENTTELNYADKNPTILIQTDKSKYKPGDLVQFRVLFLDENTRPAKIEKPINVIITDGGQNRLKQWKNIELTKGVYSGEFQLSEQPVLGDWVIEAEIEDGFKQDKNFIVEKYVLPKFEVTIDTDKDVAYAEGGIKLTVRAKYTYGKPVKGHATVTLYQGHVHYSPQKDVKAEKTVDVNGKGHVEFDFNKDSVLKFATYIPAITISVVMKEELTGDIQNASTSVNVHHNAFKIEGIITPTNFKPNELVTYNVAVKDLRGAPIADTKNPIKLILSPPSHSYWRAVKNATDISDANSLEFISKINEQGIAMFEFKMPENAVRYYSVSCKYLDVDQYLAPIHKFEPAVESVENLNIAVKTDKPQLGEPISVDIKSPEDIPYFVYVLVARGNIEHMEYVEVPDNSKVQNIKFMPTFRMVPSVALYVHYVKNGELHFEEYVINLEKTFENTIEISANPQAKPGETVNLNIKSDADSYVGLLAVDQSVLLLKSGNDLSKEDVFNKLQEHNTKTPWMRGFGRYPGEKSGLITMTNAKYPYNEDFLIRFHGIAQPLYFKKQAFGADSTLYLDSMPVENNIETEIVKTREEFPESWIFQNITNADGNDFTLTKKIPDTITSWVVTGFSINQKTGLALTDNPTKIKVFQPFFVSTHLPYSVKRGEVISIPVIIFNYMEKALDAEITMDNSNEDYEFVEVTNEVEDKYSKDIERVKRTTVPPNTGKTVHFLIHPKKVGDIPLKIKAVTPLAGDAINQMLKVEPEGVTQYGNKAVFINLKDTDKQNESFIADIPKEVVPDSEYIEFVVVGDLLGPTIKNLDNLVRMPYGCGEQNMVNFVPNILVMHYLDIIQKAQPKLRERAQKYMEIGYQRELTYKHDNGSYSAFGKSDKSGSTWLTAYVVRSFHQAQPYVDIDRKVLEQGLEFLSSTQAENGSFIEHGRLFDFVHQTEVSLTAFVLLAFLENKEYLEKYKPEITKGLEFLNENAAKTDDLYSIAITALAAQQAKHPMAEKLLSELEQSASTENGKKWWSKKQTDGDQKKLYHVSNNDVELTSYILLAILESKGLEESLPIIKWLITQRNSNGGFSSTQDTVMGLQAVIKFAEKTGTGQGNLDIDFMADDNADSKGSINVNEDNSLLVQTHVLPKSVRKVDILAKGKGVSMVQLSYRYNVAEKEKEPSFEIDVNVKNKQAGHLTLDVCSTYTPKDETNTQSNMIVTEIALPSGYTVEKEELEKLIDTLDLVMRVETKDADSKAVIYIESLKAGDKLCVNIFATRTHDVAKQKPAAVNIYDYYDTSRRATEYYEIESSLSEICQSESC